MGQIRAAVSKADLVIAGNDYLGQVSRFGLVRPDRVRVIPTCIDTEPV